MLYEDETHIHASVKKLGPDVLVAASPPIEDDRNTAILAKRAAEEDASSVLLPPPLDPEYATRIAAWLASRGVTNDCTACHTVDTRYVLGISRLDLPSMKDKQEARVMNTVFVHCKKCGALETHAFPAEK